MPSHVALLRAVNVGGRNKVSMVDLRRLATVLGLADVATYIQSGNLVFTTPRPSGEVAAELERVIESDLNVRCGVVVITRDELAAALAANPFPVEDAKRVHLVFNQDDFEPDQVAAVEAAEAKARTRGSSDRAAVRGRTIYLDTPDGMGRSELAAQMARSGPKSGTARNVATVTRLLSMLDS